MPFKRAGVRYSTTSEPETPLPARRPRSGTSGWDRPRVQARNWRLMAFGCLALTGISSGGMVWQAARSTITPYVVEVDHIGDVHAVGAAAQAYHPTDAQIAYHPRTVHQRRALALPLDPIVLRQDWLEGYDYTTDKGAAALNDFARSNDPFGKVGKQTIAGGGDQRGPRLLGQLPGPLDRAPLRHQGALTSDRPLDRHPRHRAAAPPPPRSGCAKIHSASTSTA